MNFGFDAPDLSGLVNSGNVSNEQVMSALREVMEYQVQLSEQLRYMFSNIDSDNLAEDLKKEIAVAGESAETVRRLEDAEGNVMRLREEAEAFQRQMTNIEGYMSDFIQTAEELSTRMQNAEGDITLVSQTAQRLTSRVEDAEGDVSAMVQEVGRFSLRLEGAEGQLSTFDQYLSGFILAVDNNRFEFDANGLTLKNKDGLTVMWQDMDGNLTQRGRIYATGGTIGGLTIGPNRLESAMFSISIDPNNSYTQIGDLRWGQQTGLIYGKENASGFVDIIFAVSQNGMDVRKWNPNTTRP